MFAFFRILPKILALAILAVASVPSFLLAGDGTAAANPFVITDDNAATFLHGDYSYIFDDGLYYRIDTAVTLDPQYIAVLGSTSAQNHMSVTGSAAFLDADYFIIGNEKNSGDWLTLTNDAKASFTKLFVGNADSTAVVGIDNSTLTVSGNPGTFYVGTIGRGIINISGYGSLTTNETAVAIGSQWDSGFGNITISGGGTMTNTAAKQSVYLGCSGTISSYLTVTGKGSAWIANETVLIGDYGDASQLMLADGGLAMFGSLPTVGSAASIVIDDGYLAIKSDALLTDSALIALNLNTVQDDSLVPVTASNIAMLKLMGIINVVYYDGTNNVFSSCPIYNECAAKGIDLTGYTVVHAYIIGLLRSSPTTEQGVTLCVDGGTIDTPDNYKTSSSESWTNVYAGYCNLNNFMTVDGGTFTNTDAQIAVDSGSSGSVTVTGPSTVWNTTGTLTDGVTGTARFCVYKGATVSAATAIVGKNGSGTCLVSDSGTLFTVGNLSIGASGSGTLKIISGALVVADELTCNRGAVQIDGGYLAVKSSGILDAAVIGAMHLYYYDGTSFASITSDNLATLVKAGLLKVTYYDSDNYAVGDILYDTFNTKGVNLAGYTVIHGGLSDMGWADNDLADNGWFTSIWYGQYYAGVDYNGWIWSTTNGWQYITVAGTDGVVIWDAATGTWCYTGRDIYPCLYDYSTGGWYYYTGGTAPKRVFWSWLDNGYVTR